MILDQRKKKVLKTLIEEYIRTAKPISSLWLVKKSFPQLSSATLRNEMVDLSQDGYLVQPHLAGGRLPTTKGLKFFLNYLLKEEKISEKEKRLFSEASKNIKEQKEKNKNLAKKLAEATQEMVFIAFSKNDVYYTGFSYLFHQPEFKDYSLTCNFSEIIDHLDKVIKEIFDKVQKTEILIGEENPFGDLCASIVTVSQLFQQKTLLGLLGPLRMNYSRHLALINLARKILSQKD